MFIKWHLLHSCFDFVQISGTDIYEISFYFLEYGFTTSNIIKWWKYIYCAYLIMCVSELYSDFCHQVDCYCRSFAYSSPDASYVSYNGKICKDMWGAEFKMLSTCVCVCVIFVASKKFCDPNCYYFVQSQGNIAKWRKKEGDKVSYTQSFIWFWKIKAELFSIQCT